jgi:hypothetical protein
MYITVLFKYLSQTKKSGAHTYTRNEHFLVLFLEYTRHTKKKIYICIYYLQTENKRTNRDVKRERERKIVNVVDNVKYVVLDGLVVIELLLVVVMIHLIFVHDDELLDLI